MLEPEIFCPKCRWHPKADSQWQCVPSCGTVWNTFWTRGVCPGCHYQWRKTQCLECKETSPHEDWYHYPEGAGSTEDESVVNVAGA
jgi:C4-type Zn-finger protein